MPAMSPQKTPICCKFFSCKQPSCSTCPREMPKMNLTPLIWAWKPELAGVSKKNHGEKLKTLKHTTPDQLRWIPKIAIFKRNHLFPSFSKPFWVSMLVFWGVPPLWLIHRWFSMTRSSSDFWWFEEKSSRRRTGYN